MNMIVVRKYSSGRQETTLRSLDSEGKLGRTWGRLLLQAELRDSTCPPQAGLPRFLTSRQIPLLRC